MAGLSRPWASRDEALFWFWMLRLSASGALLLAAGGLVAWAVLLQPLAIWWHGGGWRLVTAVAVWTHWLRVAAESAGALGLILFGLLAWYCDGMLRMGKAE